MGSAFPAVHMGGALGIERIGDSSVQGAFVRREGRNEGIFRLGLAAIRPSARVSVVEAKLEMNGVAGSAIAGSFGGKKEGQSVAEGWIELGEQRAGRTSDGAVSAETEEDGEVICSKSKGGRVRDGQSCGSVEHRLRACEEDALIFGVETSGFLISVLVQGPMRQAEATFHGEEGVRVRRTRHPWKGGGRGNARFRRVLR